MKWLIFGIVAIVVNLSGGSDPGERADVQGQGGEGPLLAESGATLTRSGDGIRVGAIVPTPTPGSYE
jgi:hypothetical protein